MYNLLGWADLILTPGVHFHNEKSNNSLPILSQSMKPDNDNMIRYTLYAKVANKFISLHYWSANKMKAHVTPGTRNL